MATSAAQIEANRANAQHSTGPKTEEGKRASSANATRAGLTSAKIFVPAADAEAFQQFKLALSVELCPNGQMQNQLFDVILHAAWNIRRCIELEADVQNEAIEQGLPDAILDDNLSRKLDRLYRYKKMHENSQRKATAELRRLQTEAEWRVQAIAATRPAEQHDELPQIEILTDTQTVYRNISRVMEVKATQEKAQNSRELRAYLDPDFAARQARNQR